MGALVAVAVATLVLALVLGDEDDDRFVYPEGNSTLEAARAFRGFPLYFAGPEVAGLGLAAVQRTDRTSPAPHVQFSFFYGGCELPDSEGGCSVPLQILVWPECYRYETRYSIPARERTSLRGVPGRISDEPRRLELYPSGSTIVVNGFGLSSKDELLRVGRRLRGVNVPLTTGAALPARSQHAGHTIRCGASER